MRIHVNALHAVLMAMFFKVVYGTRSYSGTKQYKSHSSFNASTTDINDVKTIDNIRVVVVRKINMPGTATFTVTGGGVSATSTGTYILSASGTITITFNSPQQGAADTRDYSGYSVYAFDVDDIDDNRPEVQTSAPSTLDKTLIVNVDTVSKLYPPNFPSTIYTSSQDHYWLIKSPCQSYLLHIDLYFLDVRCNDRFYVYDGNTTSGINWNFTSCQSNPPSDISELKTSPGGSQYALIRLDGDGGGGYGFWLEYYVNTGDYTTALSSYNTATTNKVCSTNERLVAYCPFGEESKLILQMIETDNSYQATRSCQWTIIGDDYTHVVQIDFDYLDVENETYCFFDSVKVYDDETVREDRLLNTLCGAAAAQSSIYSSGQFLTLVFKTDYSLEFWGFKLKYKSLNVTTTTDFTTSCLGHITPTVVEYLASATDTEQMSHSGYDGTTNKYSNNYDMYWLIKNPNAAYASESIVINITEILIEKSPDCRYDRVIIYQGPCTNGENAIVDQYCDVYYKTFVYPAVQYRLVRFHTDWDTPLFGFKFTYRIEGSNSYTAPTTAAPNTTHGPPVSKVAHLINEVLERSTPKYDRDLRPMKYPPLPVPATMDFYLKRINDLDEENQKMKITGYFIINWLDEYLVWEPNKKSTIQSLQIPQDDVWKPDLVLINGYNGILEMGSSFMYVTLRYNGTVEWTPLQVMELVCNIDLTDYPYDTQTCFAKFKGWTGTSSAHLSILMGTSHFKVDSDFQENEEWSLESTESSIDTTGSANIFTYTIRVKRKPVYQLYYQLLPLILISSLNAFSFILPVGSGEKSDLCIFLFIVLLFNNLILIRRSPESFSGITFYNIYSLLLMGISSVILIVSFCLVRVHYRDLERNQIPACLKTLTRGVESFRGLFVGFSVKSRKPMMDWMDVASALGFLFFWIFFIIIVLTNVIILTNFDEHVDKTRQLRNDSFDLTGRNHRDGILNYI